MKEAIILCAMRMHCIYRPVDLAKEIGIDPATARNQLSRMAKSGVLYEFHDIERGRKSLYMTRQISLWGNNL